jgi:hypothetical protein
MPRPCCAPTHHPTQPLEFNACRCSSVACVVQLGHSHVSKMTVSLTNVPCRDCVQPFVYSCVLLRGSFLFVSDCSQEHVRDFHRVLPRRKFSSPPLSPEVATRHNRVMIVPVVPDPPFFFEGHCFLLFVVLSFQFLPRVRSTLTSVR